MADDRFGATRYLQAWHDRHPGATSAVLGSLVDEAGRSSYRILAEATPDGNEPVLDVACGDGQLLELLRTGRSCVGVDCNGAELGSARRRLGQATPLLQADAARLPVVTASVGAVTCHFALMLLQPLEEVLSELARVLRSEGVLAAVLPSSPSGDQPTPWTAFRTVWRDVTANYPVDIPPLQDDRTLQPETLTPVLTATGFTSVATRSFSVSKLMTVDEVLRSLLLTYLPDLLPAAGFVELKDALERALWRLASRDGTIPFAEQADLVTARRRPAL